MLNLGPIIDENERGFAELEALLDGLLKEEKIGKTTHGILAQKVRGLAFQTSQVASAVMTFNAALSTVMGVGDHETKRYRAEAKRLADEKARQAKEDDE